MKTPAGIAVARSKPPRSRWQTLLRRTQRRLRLAALSRRGVCVFLVLAGLYGASFLFIRLTGLGRAYLAPAAEPLVLLCLPLTATLVAWLLPSKPTLRDAAREVDRRASTNDLFLTMVLLDGSAGEFQPLVAAMAEAKAAAIKPRDVAPLGINRRLALVASALVGFVALVHFVPQLDPFGKVAAAQQTAKELQELSKTSRETKERVAQIERENLSDTETKEVKRALDQLKTAVKAAQPKARQANGNMLAEAQKGLADQWRKLSSDKLRDLLAHSSLSMAQQFGTSSAAAKKWHDELQAGSTEALKKEMAGLQRDLEELTKTKDAVTKASLQKRIRERLDALSEFAHEQAGSKTLAAALKRVQDQLRMASKTEDEPSAREAMQAASESMKLAQKELEQVAQSVKDLKELEKALEVLQMAKRLNGEDALDGKKCEGCQSLAEYEALFAKMMQGGELGDEGIGEGGVAPEDESKSSKFKTEMSKSHITKGKVLLTLKTKGQGEKVDVKESYRKAVRDVKQGISEAILQEEIPPGYHEAIKGYFDSLEETPK